MRTITEAARTLPVLEYDVFVAGAGTAGCIAAIAAARAVARVLLVEKLPVPGGTYTNGGIGTYSYFASCGSGEAPRRIVGGLPFELAERLEAEGGAMGFLPTPGDKHRIPCRFVADHEVYKGVISEMLLASGVDVLLQTQLAGLICEDGRIRCAVSENKDGRRAAAAKVFVDATGDGDAARHAGCSGSSRTVYAGSVTGNTPLPTRLLRPTARTRMCSPQSSGAPGRWTLPSPRAGACHTFSAIPRGSCG